jgi:hypothetical protein
MHLNFSRAQGWQLCAIGKLKSTDSVALRDRVSQCAGIDVEAPRIYELPASSATALDSQVTQGDDVEASEGDQVQKTSGEMDTESANVQSAATEAQAEGDVSQGDVGSETSPPAVTEHSADEVADIDEDTTKEKGARGFGLFVLTLVALAVVGGVASFSIRRYRLRWQQYSEFGGLEMRGYSQWQNDAGLG